MHRYALAFLLVVLLAGPVTAYTVYLKDGSRIQADSEIVVKGENAIITLPNGTRTSIKMSEIDVERTEKANEHSLGDAFVVEGGLVTDTPAPPEPQRRGPNLSDVAARRQLPESFNRRPTGSGVDGGDLQVPMTESGYPDLLRFQRQPHPQSDLSGRILVMLRNQGVEQAALYRGTQTDRVFLEVTTNSEAMVFRAIEAAANVLLDIRPEVDAIELYLATNRRVKAGQFLITPERAEELASNALDTSDFFLRYVEF